MSYITSPQHLTGRFGVEIELNSLDKRDFVSRPLLFGEKPNGMDEIFKIITSLGFDCELQNWQYNHNSIKWSCKPDSSCGIEVCSPVMDSKSKSSLFELTEVIDAINSNCFISFDHRCSLHVHLEFFSFDEEIAAAVLAWWIKCEHVFIDFASPVRKNNFYCKPIGITDLINSDEEVCSNDLIKKLKHKHFSINCFHFFYKRRPTLEFRIGEGTKNSTFVKNWVKLLLSFADSAILKGLPKNYNWLNPKEVLDFLNLNDLNLKKWFIDRLCENTCCDSSECFSKKNRQHAFLIYMNEQINSSI